MADPTRTDPSHKKLTRPGSKIFDPDPSLVPTNISHFTNNYKESSKCAYQHFHL